MKKYLLGLDLGTNSVGWSLTDENYNIIKKNGKSLHGVRMFKEAEDASVRRGFRANRRRLRRRRERVELVQSLLIEEIVKVDKHFIDRLDESFLRYEDRSIKETQSLFVEKDFNDKNYYKQYPTIYHLRSDLVNSTEKKDIRLIYLALHHMVKYRGHFLSENFEVKNVSSLDENLNQVNEMLQNLNFTFQFVLKENDSITDLFIESKGINKASVNFKEYFNTNKIKKDEVSFAKNYIDLMVGKSIKVNKLFKFEQDELDQIDEDILNKSIDFKSENYENDLLEIEKSFSDRYEFKIIISLKKLYDQLRLAKLLGSEALNSKTGNDLLSQSMIKRYNLHKSQLSHFKKFIKNQLGLPAYNKMFRIIDDKLNNYSKYAGLMSSNGVKERTSHCNQTDFYKYVTSVIKPTEDSEDKKLILQAIEDNNFLPRLNSSEFSVIPYQLNKLEMEAILKNQSKYYEFLLQKEGNTTVLEKLLLILEYKIPYYFGPLVENKNNNSENELSKFSWLVRKKEGKIYPWNIDELVDSEETSINFMERLLNKCSYLTDKKCLPKNSIIYQYFNVLNELNKLFVNGKELDISVKKDIIKTVYLNQKATKKSLLDYFKSNYGEEVTLTTSTLKEVNKVQSSMSTYIDLKSIFGEEYIENNFEKIELIIKDISIFEDKKLLKKRLSNSYNITDENILKRLLKLKYSGFGRLSKELLCDLKANDVRFKEVCFTEDGEAINVSIIKIMEETNYNFMEIIAQENSSFIQAIEEHNNDCRSDYKDYKEFINDQFVSPGMKRPMMQAMAIIDELERILSTKDKKVKIHEYYIESPRTNKAEKKRTTSRKEKLTLLYEEALKIAKEINNSELNHIKSMSNKLESTPENQLNGEKLYLYFSQFGKDMYTLDDIDIADLYDNKYDVDHIVPQSLIKDDSLENKVLTLRTINIKKSNSYPIDNSLLCNGNANKAKQFYTFLLNAKMIGKKKYHNLTRVNDLTESELNEFVNRQLVYTSQATKALKDVILKFKTTDDFKPLVVFSKAENVSDFRKQFDIVKSRLANNHHHAHDAYLNVVVGRTLSIYYNYGKLDYIKNNFNQKKLTLNAMKVFCKVENDNTITVKEVFDKKKNIVWSNDILNKVKNNIYNRFDIMTSYQETLGNTVFSKISIIPQTSISKKTAYPIKNLKITNDLRKHTIKEIALSKLSNVSVYGGYDAISYFAYSLIKREVKGKPVVTLVPISKYFIDISKRGTKEFREQLITYFEKEKDYKNVTIIEDIVKQNVSIYIKNSKGKINGVSSSLFIVQNTLEMFYKPNFLKTIKLMEKLVTLLALKKMSLSSCNSLDLNEKIPNIFIDENKLILNNLSPKNQTKMIIEFEELNKLFSYLKKKLSSEIFEGFISYKNVSDFVLKEETNQIFNNLDVFKKIETLLEIIDYIASSTKATVNLTNIGGVEKAGNVRINSNLPIGSKLVSKSVTGYYEKVIYEVK